MGLLERAVLIVLPSRDAHACLRSRPPTFWLLFDLSKTYTKYIKHMFMSWKYWHINAPVHLQISILILVIMQWTRLYYVCNESYLSVRLGVGVEDSSESADSELVLLTLSQSCACCAYNWARCSREKCVPRARRLYSNAFSRNSITSLYQEDETSVLSSDSI